MPKPSYISLEIDGVLADIDPKGQVPTVSYSLEDENDFEQKKSAESLNIEMPGTLINDQIHNTLHNPSIIDNTPNGSNDNFKALRYIANGEEILIGKYLAQSVTKLNGRPEKYRGKAYGLNGDWVIDLKEKTLMDFVNPRTHNFDIPAITQSWSFDGTSEAADYVYAPVRYRKRFGTVPPATLDPDDIDPVAPDNNVIINDLKPAISIYWLLWRGLKSVGYRIVSTFMDTAYYRRSVMPWTWGGFDYIDDIRWEPLKFLAGQMGGFVTIDPGAGNSISTYPDLNIKDDNSLVPGTYDNSNLFTYTSAASTLPFLMVWQYPSTAPLSLGAIQVSLSVLFQYGWEASNNGDVVIKVHWYKNGVQVQEDIVLNEHANVLQKKGPNLPTDIEVFFVQDILPGDYIGCRIHVHVFRPLVGLNNVFTKASILVEAFTLNFIRMGPGSTVDFKNNYPKFKNYKWLDLLRGEIDCFDLSIQTDPIRKEVYIEPTHAYEINGTSYSGYYNRNQLDWSEKIDIGRESELELFSDYERELLFKFREDSNDGGLKKIQDRNQAVIGMAKYVLPERFKTERKERENRFYSPVMHRDHQGFKFITGVAPQLIAIIPENISNTSNDASENTYNPKRAWYKGNVSGFGGWKFEGIVYTNIPYMFAVNYKVGGDIDPVLSYSDQLIGDVIAKGLMKKFFLQRLAIFRHGRRYIPIYVMLNNYDVMNFLHRESIIIENIEYLLTSIQNYDPIEPESTACKMWMFLPFSETDRDNSYPSIQNIRSGGIVNPMDIKHWPHLMLTSDIPEPPQNP